MDATWAYMDQFVWKHPLKSGDADTILVDRGGHTRVQAYEMVMSQSDEEGNALSTAAFVLACLSKANLDDNNKAHRVPDDWTHGAPWLIVPDKELATVEAAITKLRMQSSHHVESTWAQKEWYRCAKGDRDSFRMIPDSSLAPQEQRNVQVPSHPSHKRAGPRTNANDQDRASKQRTQGLGRDHSSGWWEQGWVPGQSAASSSGASQTHVRDWDDGNNSRPKPPDPPLRRGGRLAVQLPPTPPL